LNRQLEWALNAYVAGLVDTCATTRYETDYDIRVCLLHPFPKLLRSMN